MGKNPKALIGAAFVVVIGVLIFMTYGPLAGVLVLAAGGVAVFFLARGVEDTETSRDFLDAEPPRPRRERASTSTIEEPTEGGLPTWQPEPLEAWTPGGEVEFDEDDTFEELASLDDIDPIAEVERLDAMDESVDLDTDLGEFETEFGVEVEAEEAPAVEAPKKVSLFSAPRPSFEDVHSDDDIMKASQATELHIAGAPGEEAVQAGPGTNSELAKLLAKVQSRLAAYE